MFSPDGNDSVRLFESSSVRVLGNCRPADLLNVRTPEQPNARTPLTVSGRARRVGLTLAWLAMSWVWAPAALALVVSDVAKEFVCSCGCNKMLTDCDMQCGEQLRGVIAAKIGEGWDKPRIMNLLVKNYGEKLLAAPTKSGFNLTAWVTPFAAIILGGVMITLVVGEWVARRRATRRVRLALPAAGVEGKYLARVDDELRHFD